MHALFPKATNRQPTSVAGPFDNRVLFDERMRRRASPPDPKQWRYRIRRFFPGFDPVVRRVAGDHYRFEVDGRIIVYCYIRKNACSAFKRMIIDTSPHRERFHEFAEPKAFMDKYHRLERLEEINKSDISIFVYRDPLERVVSLFRNKFIAREGEIHVFRSYRDLIGKDPNDASFTEFVNNYLGSGDQPFRRIRLDPHCFTQHFHLLPIAYSHAIPMKELSHQMYHVLTPATAKLYFGKRVNATPSIEYDEPSHLASASELRRRFSAGEGMPSLPALVTDELRERILSLYLADIRLIEGIRQKRTAFLK